MTNTNTMNNQTVKLSIGDPIVLTGKDLVKRPGLILDIVEPNVTITPEQGRIFYGSYEDKGNLYPIKTKYQRLLVQLGSETEVVVQSDKPKYTVTIKEKYNPVETTTIDKTRAHNKTLYAQAISKLYRSMSELLEIVDDDEELQELICEEFPFQESLEEVHCNVVGFHYTQMVKLGYPKVTELWRETSYDLLRGFHTFHNGRVCTSGYDHQGRMCPLQDNDTGEIFEIVTMYQSGDTFIYEVKVD